MNWITETVNKENKILIVDIANNKIAKQFKDFLSNLACANVYYLTKTISFDKFDYIFIFDDKKIVFSDIRKNIKKYIYYKGNFLDQKNFDHILWFCFSSSSVKNLSLRFLQIKTTKQKNKHNKFNHYLYLTKKKLVFAILFLFLILNSFIFFTILSNYYFYLSIKNTEINQHQSKEYFKVGEQFFFIAKKTYQIPRSLYLLLGFGIFFDNLIDFTEEVRQLLANINKTKITFQELFQLVNNPSYTINHKKLGRQYANDLNRLLDLSEKNLFNINQKAPFFIKKNQKYKNLVEEVYPLIGSLKKITLELDKILGATDKKKYLILFANNRELRPGGGFIGSFAILELEDFQKKSFSIYDVYDADGQLKIHVEPPLPIKTYLNQPHWFLRDSAFSPDFEENFKVAQFFLDKEIKLGSLDGGILVTTSAVENILKAFGDLYLPDYKEKINSNNFYLKTQLYTEKKFFPGSIQKKTFLNSIIQQIFVNFNRAAPVQLMKEIKKSLDEKHIVLYFNDKSLMKSVDSLLWSGKIVFSDCVIKNYHCVNNYFFPYDANLGVNKVDYFIDKSVFLEININQDGKITNNLTLQYVNNSPSYLFPGGDYKNYFQIYLPKQINIKFISKNGAMIENYLLEEENGFNLIGFYFELQPKKNAEIKIIFENQNPLKKGRNLFQLIFQKQIGALNKDFILNINLPHNIGLLDNNFLPLVKDNQINYNSILNTDKIFYLILDKKQ